MPAPPAVADPGPPRWRLGPRGQRWFDGLLLLGLLAPLVTYLPLGLYPTELLLAATQLVPLLWRRSHPVAVFAVVAVSSAAQALLVDTPLWNQVAFPIATYAVARYARPLLALGALLVGYCGAAVAAYVWLQGFADSTPKAPDDSVTLNGWISYAVTIALIVTAAWALGSLTRVRHAYEQALLERGRRLEAEAAQRAELAAADERARIAREMHDVVAHGLSVIVVQADGARYAAALEPRLATDALETIAATGREALTEMRRLLGLLRAGPGDTSGTRPQPRLPDVAELVAEARAAGTAVTADLPETWPEVADGIAVTAYRVVQEALTNVRKHAGPGAAVRVRAALEGGHLAVLVEDDGRGAAADDDGHGLGLLGMRERVAVHGGELEAGPRPGGGFSVSARIPV